MLIFADGRERISQDAECDRESVRGAFDGNKHTPDIYEDGSSRLSCCAVPHSTAFLEYLSTINKKSQICICKICRFLLT